jgi:hypothetical protein
MEGQCTSALIKRRHRPKCLKVFNDMTTEIADMNFIWGTEIALGYNADGPLFNPELRKLVRDCLDQCLESTPIGAMCASV